MVIKQQKISAASHLIFFFFHTKYSTIRGIFKLEIFISYDLSLARLFDFYFRYFLSFNSRDEFIESSEKSLLRLVCYSLNMFVVIYFFNKSFIFFNFTLHFI